MMVLDLLRLCSGWRELNLPPIPYFPFLFCFWCQWFLALPDIKCQFEGRCVSMRMSSLSVGSREKVGVSGNCDRGSIGVCLDNWTIFVISGFCNGDLDGRSIIGSEWCTAVLIYLDLR